MKTFTKAEELCINRLKEKGTPLWDIADRLGISVVELTAYIKRSKGKSCQEK